VIVSFFGWLGELRTGIEKKIGVASDRTRMKNRALVFDFMGSVNKKGGKTGRGKREGL